MKKLFACCYGILLIVMQQSNALTLEEADHQYLYYYEDALGHLPPQQQTLLTQGQQFWIQYRELRCQLHESAYKGNINQCKVVLTFRFNNFLKLLRPNQLEMIRFMHDKIRSDIIRFQQSDVNYLGRSFEENISHRLTDQYTQFYQNIDIKEQMKLQKSYIVWKSYRNQLCLLLKSRNIINYNYCSAKLSLDIIADMQHYQSH